MDARFFRGPLGDRIVKLCKPRLENQEGERVLRVSFRRIRPGKEARLREWLAELGARADEVRATFVDETVRHEQAFVIATVEGPVLVYAMEAADFEHGRQAFMSSNRLIDVQHQQVMVERLGDRLEVQPLYDVALADALGADS